MGEIFLTVEVIQQWSDGVRELTGMEHSTSPGHIAPDPDGVTD